MKNLSSLLLGLTLMGGAAISSGVAHAECEAAYTSDAMLGDIQVMATSLQAKDAATLKSRGEVLQAGLVCLREPMPPALYATVYRMLGVAAFENGDPKLADQWFHTALELDPTHEWDIADVPPGTPLFQAYAAAGRVSTASTPIEGMVLNAPAGSKLLIDGRPLEEAAATPGRFHLIQQVSTSNGAVRASWLVMGNELPAQLLMEQSLSRNEVKEQEEEADNGKGRRKDDEVLAGGYTESEVTSVARERPRAKIPLLAAGGVGLLAAGGIYAASFATEGQFNEATTTEDLLAAQQLTNTLVIASGGALLMGAGVGVWGVVIDDGGTPGLWALPPE
jgi:hypothetical protein